MSERRIKERLFNVNDLPTIDAIHGRILKILEDVNYSVSDASALIEKDQVLSAKVLKLVNSPLYGFHGDVASIRRAVILLGANLIRGLVLSTSLFDAADKTLPGIWDHAYCCSTIAGFLAKRLNLIAIEEVMAGALLHDIGKIVILKQLPKEASDIYNVVQSKGVTMLEAEREVIGFTHDEVGLWLAERWNLPKIIKDIIAFHHMPGACAAHPKEASIVHLVNIIVKGVGVVSIKDPFVPRIDGHGWSRLLLSEDELVDIIVEIIDIIQADSLLSKYIGEGGGR